jgi:hypothetical protein
VVSKNEKMTFTETKSFNIENHSDDFEFCEQYLRNVKGQYEYSVKNKNGEPLPGVLIDISFAHKFYYRTVEKCLKTDENGVIHLGALKNIKFVSSQQYLTNACSSTRLPEKAE